MTTQTVRTVFRSSRHTLPLLGFLIVLFVQARAQDSTLAPKLRALRGVTEVKVLAPLKGFAESYELRFRQPLNHQNAEGPAFLQRVYVSHRNADRPVVLETEGYAALANRPTELAGILKSNQVIVEHRYFGRSRPDSLQWEYLTLKQSAEDLHAVVQSLKGLYRGKWVSTGASKGGQTTLVYRYWFPDDVDASVPYVAPVPLAQEDPRVFTFLNTVGDSTCRARIKAYQLRMLRDEAGHIRRLEDFSKTTGTKFSIGIPMAYEYAVLEYPFAFWQYGNSACENIPGPGASDSAAFDHLAKVVGFYLFSDAGVGFFGPFYYQAYTELGYYRYDITDFRGLLKTVRDATNRIFVPAGASVTYHCESMQNLNRWLQTKGDRIIYLYGETDTWTACAVQLTGQADALKFINKGGPHGSRIRDLTPGQKEMLYAALERWLSMTIER
jgi:hypothetical protein